MSGARIGNLVTVAIVLLVLGVLFLLLRPTSPGSGDVEEVQAEVETVAVAINEGSMSPSEITVYEGDQVNLQITSDRPIEFHVHGYDLTEEVEPGETSELLFDATNTGRFPIEDHDAHAEIGALLVQPR